MDPTLALFVEHTPGGGPGYLDRLFREHGIRTRTVHAHRSGIPDTVRADYLVLMGSDQPVKEMPWYAEEIAIVQAHLREKRPVMGVCAGAELIALALGGELQHLGRHAYGWQPVQSPAGPGWVFEWHDDYFETPLGAELIVRGGPEDRCQAYRGPGYLGTQFHPEVTAEILDEWTNRDPRVSATGNSRNAARILSSQRIARWLVNGFLGPAQLRPVAAAHRHRLIMRPYGGAVPGLTHHEARLAHLMQQTLRSLADSVDLTAEDPRSALQVFDSVRQTLTGRAFHQTVTRYCTETAQMGLHAAAHQLVRAHVKVRPLAPMPVAAAADTRPGTGIIAPTQNPEEFFVPWPKPLIEGMTDHTVQHFDRIADDLKQRLSDTLTDGYENGETIRDLDDRVQEVLGVDERRANERARTLTMETYNQAHIYQYQEAGVPSVEWQATDDERECEICGDLDGTVFSLDDPDLVRPPVHNYCLLPETRCEAPGGIIVGLRSRYDGPVQELTFASGAWVTVTPNHMLLTPHGFAAAKFLREGDDVFNCANLQGLISGNPDDHGEPSTIKEIFESLTKTPGMHSARVPAAPEDLHGDVYFGDGYIDVVAPAGFLGNAGKSADLKHLTANHLNTSSGISSSLFSKGPLTDRFFRLALAAEGGMSGIRQSSAFFRSRPAHPEIHGLAAVAGCDPILYKDPTDSSAVGIKPGRESFNGQSFIKKSDNLFGIQRSDMRSQLNPAAFQQSMDVCEGNSLSLNNLINRQSGFVKIDNLIGIKVLQYHGYVYDLQTASSLLIGNSILMSNCRCTLIPSFETTTGSVSDLVSEDTLDFVQNWRKDYFNIPLYSTPASSAPAQIPVPSPGQIPEETTEPDTALPEYEKDAIMDPFAGVEMAEAQQEDLPDSVYDYGKKQGDIQAVAEYTKTSGDFNKYLRDGTPPAPGLSDGGIHQMNKMIAQMDQIIEKAPGLPEGLVMWRGLGAESGAMLIQKSIGDICQDKGFQSFSLNPSVAEHFTAGTMENPNEATLLRVVTAGGEKGFYNVGNELNEYEMIMARGTSWQIVAKEDVAFGREGIHHIITVVRK